MYSNQWLNLCRFYFKEYKQKVSDVVHPQSDVYFIFDMPGDAELCAGHAAAGEWASKMAKMLGFEGGQSLGEVAQQDVRVSVLNVCAVPLQKTTNLDEKYGVLFETLDALVYEKHARFGSHEFLDANKFEQAILYDFKNRLLKSGCFDHPCQVIVCGDFSKTYFEKLGEVSTGCEVLYVTETSCDLENLNIL